jgi:hypothetical protein
MKQKLLFALGVIGILSLTSCVEDNHSSSSLNSSSEEPLDSTYIGMGEGATLEAYCWREKGEWRSGLLPTTNRLKTTAEVDALKGISLDQMKRVLRTYDPQKASIVPFRVSRPCQAGELSHEAETSATGKTILAYLNDHLGLVDGKISLAAPLPSYPLTLDKEAKTFATQDYSGLYPAKSWVEVSAYPLTDVDLDLYLNGTLTSRSYSFSGESKWTYFFQMPTGDTTLSFHTYSYSYVAFTEAYPWAKDLKEESIEKIEALSSNFDIGPGGMNSYYHGDTSADKKAFLDFSQDNTLREDRAAAAIDGGLPVSFTITIGGTAHSFVLNGKALDSKYISSKSLAKPSSFDYSAFIPYNDIALWDKDNAYARVIKDGSFLSAVHFQPYTPSETPALTGYHFALGAGVYFIDAKHFKYSGSYYAIVSTADFASYING